MLHEIILALHGCLSSILFKNSHAVELEKVLHPSEKALLKRILQIGETYGNIQAFIEENICPVVEFDLADQSNYEGVTSDGGIYLQAFCDGLQKVLANYRNDIVALEKIAIQDPYISLTSINSHVGGYSQLLFTVHSMILEIKENHIHGCKLLQFICRHLCTGVETIREALSEIAKSCHSVFVNQLINWLLYGQIMDNYSEFFIRSSKSVQLSSSNHTNNDYDIIASDTNMSSSVLNKQNEAAEFILDDDFLPPYISYVTANKILYIGKTVVLFMSGLQSKSDIGNKSVVFNEEELEMIKSLQSCSFHDSQLLESVVVGLESSVTKRLWLLAMEQADLMGQIKAMKDFYLLGRGEMFVDFLNKIGTILNKQLASNIARELNVTLHASARSIQYPHEATLEKFEFKLPSKESCNQGVKVKSVIRMEYCASLPLHLFFSPVVIDNYNILFRFFLRVKQAQFNLHGIWMKDVKNKTQMLTDRSWRLRNDLMFLVENLQCYLQWDVVESEHTALMTEIKKTQDFEKIRHYHHRFLYNVLSQSFLIPNDAKFDQNTGLLLTAVLNQQFKPHTANVFLGHILDFSEAFCLLVSKNDNININDELETMSEKLGHCVKVLVKLITNLRNQISGVHLSKLLLRLDYNHYFSCSQINTSSPANA